MAHSSIAQSGQGTDRSSRGAEHIICKYRQIFDPVKAARKILGIGKGDLALLKALIEFLPVESIGTDRPEGRIVFASNKTLMERIGWDSDSTVVRNLTSLEEKGLVVRQYSSNRKRFAVRISGKVVGAFGIDLTPLLERLGDIRLAAQVAAREAEELRELRVRLMALVNQHSAKLSTGELKHYQKILRNKPTRRTLTAAIQALEHARIGTQKRPRHLHQETKKMGSDDNDNGQHKDTQEEAHFVESGCETSQPKGNGISDKTEDLLRACSSQTEFRTMLDIIYDSNPILRRAWKRCVRSLGHEISYVILRYSERRHGVRNPGGYIEKIRKLVVAGEIEVNDLWSATSGPGRDLVGAARHIHM